MLYYEDLLEIWEKRGVAKWLEEQYREQITEWFDEIRETDFEEIEIEWDTRVKGLWLGSVYAIMPSGKYYTFWCSNVTSKEAVKDQIFQEVMEEEAEKRGWSIYWRDDDIFVIKD